ncbi:MAG: formate dehydrogenase accessory sulfurtransferase FdhD [Armatimonadetes bacterium]|nr:formate dehydrogenase accessory sulfurtransferase FdhD [Armatimonadota bacterium]
MTRIVRYRGETFETTQDSVTEEVALEIRVNGEPFAITMRTPGDDFALVTGLLFAEEIIAGRDDVRAMGYGTEESDPDRQNFVQAVLNETANGFVRQKRNLPLSASCGVCGKASLAELCLNFVPIPPDTLTFSPTLLYGLPAKLRVAQEVFQRTGGLHAAGLFDADGTLLSLKEDVGRHNAVDKVIGEKVMEGATPLSNRLLLVSGRVSYEIVQKAVRARIPILCAVSAPSSLAVEIAASVGMTLIGFLRGDTMNVYTGAERIC